MAEKWDTANTKTLKGFPCSLFWNTKQLTTIKENYIRQIKRYLAQLKARENRLFNDDIYGIDIEYQLSHIAKLCGSKKNELYHGIATYIDHNFTKEQKRILYQLLNHIDENINVKVIDLYEILRF